MLVLSEILLRSGDSILTFKALKQAIQQQAFRVWYFTFSN